MADANALAAFLGSSLFGGSKDGLDDFRKTIAENDLYSQIADPILRTKYDSSTWEPSTKLGVSAGQAFLGTLLQGLGQRSQASQLDAVTKVLPSLYDDPTNVTVPEGVDPVAFGALKADTIQARRAADAKMLSDRVKSLWDLELVGPKALREAYGTQKGKDLAFGVDPSMNPESPQFKASKMLAEEEDKRRNEITTSKVYGSMDKVATLLPGLDKLAKENTKTADIPFIYQYIQAQDGTAVHSGEMTLVEGASPLIQRYKNIFESALNGQSSLTPQLKQQMVEEMRGFGRSQYEAAKATAQKPIEIGKSRGGDVSKISPFNDNYLEQLFAPRETKAIDPITNIQGSGGVGDMSKSLAALAEKVQKTGVLTPEERAFVDRAKKGILDMIPRTESGAVKG